MQVIKAQKEEKPHNQQIMRWPALHTLWVITLGTSFLDKPARLTIRVLVSDCEYLSNSTETKQILRRQCCLQVSSIQQAGWEGALSKSRCVSCYVFLDRGCSMFLCHQRRLGVCLCCYVMLCGRRREAAAAGTCAARPRADTRQTRQLIRLIPQHCCCQQPLCCIFQESSFTLV